MNEKFVLKVRNPRSVLKIEDFQGLTAPRLDSLDGKRIAVICQKPDGAFFIDPLQELLEKKYPTSTFERFTGRRSTTEEVARLKDFDGWIFGVRNTGGTATEEATSYERAGIPGVVIILDNYCLDQQKRWAMVSGVPGVRYAAISSERYFANANLPENFPAFAADCADMIIHALTDPLTEEEKNPKYPEYDYSDLVFEGKDEADVYEKFQAYFAENKLSDGIPVAPPTQEAVERMLAGTTRKPDEVIPGVMQPAHGIVTVEKIAINAVMAGAKPEYLPVIITAIEMLCDPRFYAWHHFSSMNSTNLLVAVGGPIAKELGLNGDVGYLGPGTRANNTIGRAISLCAVNLGWMDYTKMDGGMFGQPSMFCNLTFCENEALSPWEPFQVSQGFSPEDSTVMVEEVFHIDGTFWNGLDNLPSGVWTDGMRADLDRVAWMAMGYRPPLKLVSQKQSSIHLFSTLQKNPKPMIDEATYLIIMYPGQARQLAAAGYSREDVIKYICCRYRVPYMDLDSEVQENLKKLAESGDIPYLSIDDCKPGGTIPMVNAYRIGLMVAGPISGQTLGCFCLGSFNRNEDVYPIDAFSRNRSPYYIKKITGATLTKAGR